jgi:hypothetical protein
MPIIHRELLDEAAALVRYEAPILVVPVALTLVGLAVVGFGLSWNRNEARLSSRLQSSLPAWLREAIAGRRSVR